MIGFSKATVKSVQRGVYAGAGGTVTISAVDTTKAVVMSKSKSSSGYVAATGNATGTLTPTDNGKLALCGSGLTHCVGFISFPNYSISTSLSGGSTCLTAKQFSAVLTNATTLTCDGPVEWQVVEYN